MEARQHKLKGFATRLEYIFRYRGQARHEVLELARRQVRRMVPYRAYYEAADDERVGMRIVDQARQLGTTLVDRGIRP